jgi:hypothetical protein
MNETRRTGVVRTGERRMMTTDVNDDENTNDDPSTTDIQLTGLSPRRDSKKLRRTTDTSKKGIEIL